MELAILTVKHDLLFSFSGWLILVRGLYHPKENGHWLWAFIAITPTATGLKGESSLQKKKKEENKMTVPRAHSPQKSMDD